MKTQALVNEAVGAPFLLTDIELEEPQPNEVLVKMVASGLCHTDFVVQQGHIPSAFPSIQGHEGSGTILSIGSSVKDLEVGDSVLLSFASCQTCQACTGDGDEEQRKRPAGCEEWVEKNFGRRRNREVEDRSVAKVLESGSEIKGSFFGQSSFSRHALVQASSCVKVPSDTDLIALSPLGCGLQTGAGAVLNVLRPRPSESLVIWGLGAVGFGSLFAASHLSLSTIIVVDLIPSRLSLARELGAHHALDGRRPDIVDEIKRLTRGGVGAHYSIEATGVGRVLRSAWECLRYAGTVVSLGNPGPGTPAPFDIHDMVNRGISWRGIVEGDSNPPEFIPFLIKLYEEGKFPIDRLSKVYRVEEWDEAVSAMKSGEVIKPIITFQTRSYISRGY